jgi:2-C-methyl-D-erythritol 2,4-cyclodiphosphate synthase
MPNPCCQFLGSEQHVWVSEFVVNWRLSERGQLKRKMASQTKRQAGDALHPVGQKTAVDFTNRDLQHSRRGKCGQHTRTKHMQIRIGEGWDIHALGAGRKLILGGVEVPFHLGLLGHSDADVLMHAITDALLGAAAMGDIGTHFPDTDARFKGVDSSVLLAEAARRVREKGFEIGNVDSTIVAQAPKLMPHMPAMRAKLSQTLGVALDQVNVKAKTAEKMGPVGLGQAMEARAIVLLTFQGK